MVVATVTIGELNGVSPGTPTNNVANINMTAAEEVNSDPTGANVIIAGNNSYEKANYIYLELINDSNKIDNFKWWITPSTPETGITYKTNVQNPLVDDGYPGGGLVDTISTIADQAYPTTEPGLENIGVSGGSGGLDTNATRSDLMFSQLQTTGSADPGDVITKTLHAQYDEQ